MRLPLSIRLYSSRSAALALIVIHGLAVVAIAVSHFAPAAKTLLLALVAFSMARGLRLHGLRAAPGAIVALTLREGGELELEYGDSRRIVTRIDPSSTVLHWLIVLRLRHERRHLRLPLLSDAMDAEDFRQLQIWLRRPVAELRKN